MIAKKVYKCECGRSSVGFKSCPDCRRKIYNKRATEKLAKITNNVIKDNDDLDEFFEWHIKRVIRCAECGVPITKPDRWNVAHLLKKSVFKSVRSVKENAIYLCREHHAELDNTFDRAKNMKIWSEVKKRVKSFIHLVKERHKTLEHYE